MDLRKIKKLIELVEESGIAELEVKSGEEAVRITMVMRGQMLRGLDALRLRAMLRGILAGERRD